MKVWVRLPATPKKAARKITKQAHLNPRGVLRAARESDIHPEVLKSSSQSQTRYNASYCHTVGFLFVKLSGLPKNGTIHPVALYPVVRQFQGNISFFLMNANVAQFSKKITHFKRAYGLGPGYHPR